MSDPAILFVKPGSISPDDKDSLKEAGVVVIETADPSDVKFVRAQRDISGNDMLAIACKVISTQAASATQEAFGRAVCDAIAARTDQ